MYTVEKNLFKKFESDAVSHVVHMSNNKINFKYINIDYAIEKCCYKIIDLLKYINKKIIITISNFLNLKKLDFNQFTTSILEPNENICINNLCILDSNLEFITLHNNIVIKYEFNLNHFYDTVVCNIKNFNNKDEFLIDYPRFTQPSFSHIHFNDKIEIKKEPIKIYKKKYYNFIEEKEYMIPIIEYDSFYKINIYFLNTLFKSVNKKIDFLFNLFSDSYSTHTYGSKYSQFNFEDIINKKIYMVIYKNATIETYDNYSYLEGAKKYFISPNYNNNYIIDIIHENELYHYVNDYGEFIIIHLTGINLKFVN